MRVIEGFDGRAFSHGHEYLLSGFVLPPVLTQKIELLGDVVVLDGRTDVHSWRNVDVGVEFQNVNIDTSRRQANQIHVVRKLKAPGFVGRPVHVDPTAKVGSVVKVAASEVDISG